jgi:hypothetical protein
MGESNPKGAVAALRLIAAQAEKLANDVQAGKLWPGEYEDGLATISRALSDAQRSGVRAP